MNVFLHKNIYNKMYKKATICKKNFKEKFLLRKDILITVFKLLSTQTNVISFLAMVGNVYLIRMNIFFSLNKILLLLFPRRFQIFLIIVSFS